MEKNEKCKHCGMRFADPATLRKHIKYQHAASGSGAAEKPFVCRYCHKCFRWKHSLQSHLANFHGNNGQHGCRGQRECNGHLESTEGNGLSEIIMEQQSAGNKVEREPEKLEFVRFMEGSERIRIWKNSRGWTFYDCTCGARKPVRSLSKIMVHVRNGHERKEWNCKECGKEFENRFQLSAHMHTHKNSLRCGRP